MLKKKTTAESNYDDETDEEGSECKLMQKNYLMTYALDK